MKQSLGLYRCGAIALLVALVLFFRAYAGVHHDSVLYLGQAFLHLEPETFAKDVFFLYGSQAQYTLFPQFLAAMLHFFSIAQLFLWLTIIGKIFFYVSIYCLFKELIPSQYRYFALLAVACLPPIYGAFNIFSYSESFLTGRTFAEPFAILALVALIKQRWLLGGLLWLISAVIHPLIALPVVLIVWVALVFTNYRWLWLLIVPVSLLGLSFIVPSLSNALFTQYDPDWLVSVEESNKNCFVSMWRLSDWTLVVSDFFIVYLLARKAHQSYARYARTLLAATLVGFVSSFILADVFKLVLATGLQFWRIHWLLHLVAMAVVPWLLVDHYRQSQQVSIKLVLFTAIVIFSAPFFSNPYLFAVVLVLILFYFFWEKICESSSTRIQLLLGYAMAGALALHLIKYMSVQVTRFSNAGSNIDLFRLDAILLNYPLINGGILLLAVFLWNKFETKGKFFLCFLSFSFLLYAAYLFDSRSSWNKYIENNQTTVASFGVDIDKGAEVYWPNELLPTWALLKSSSYYNQFQRAGLLFKRETAIELQRRSKVLFPIEFQMELCQIIDGIKTNEDACAPAADTLREVCLAANGELDYMVFSGKIKSMSPLGEWRVPEGGANKLITFYLYRCKQFLEHY